MTNFNPTVTEEDLDAAKDAVTDSIAKVKAAKEKFSENAYSGPYKDIFNSLALEIYDVVRVVREQFEDGFQWSDIQGVIQKAYPELRELYLALKNDFYNEVPKEKYEDFFTELTKFVYYEVIDLVKVSSWIKVIFGWALRMWAAPRVGKWLTQLFLYLEDKVTNLPIDDRVKQLIDLISS